MEINEEAGCHGGRAEVDSGHSSPSDHLRHLKPGRSSRAEGQDIPRRSCDHLSLFLRNSICQNTALAYPAFFSSPSMSSPPIRHGQKAPLPLTPFLVSITNTSKDICGSLSTWAPTPPGHCTNRRSQSQACL